MWVRIKYGKPKSILDDGLLTPVGGSEISRQFVSNLKGVYEAGKDLKLLPCKSTAKIGDGTEGQFRLFDGPDLWHVSLALDTHLL